MSRNVLCASSIAGLECPTANCRFGHALDAALVQDEYKKKQTDTYCAMFAQKGACTHAEACRYLHVHLQPRREQPAARRRGERRGQGRYSPPEPSRYQQPVEHGHYKILKKEETLGRQLVATLEAKIDKLISVRDGYVRMLGLTQSAEFQGRVDAANQMLLELTRALQGSLPAQVDEYIASLA